MQKAFGWYGKVIWVTTINSTFTGTDNYHDVKKSYYDYNIKINNNNNRNDDNTGDNKNTDDNTFNTKDKFDGVALTISYNTCQFTSCIVNV